MQPFPFLQLQRSMLNEHVLVLKARELDVSKLLDAAFWVNHAGGLSAGDKVTVFSVDMAQEVSVRVMGKREKNVTVRLLEAHGVKADAQETLAVADRRELPDGIEIKWGGPHHKFQIRNGDEVMSYGYVTADAAKAAYWGSAEAA